MNKRTIDIGRLENFRSAYRRGAGAPLAGSFCRAATASAGVSELYLYGEIGEGAIAATDVVEALGKIPRGNTIRVRMNSPGGDIFDGVAIYNLFAQSSARVEVCIDALAASMASVIAMAGDDIAIAGNASMMIHEAWGVTYGNADDMKAFAALLSHLENAQIIPTYKARTGLSESRLKAMMEAETWMDAAAAIANKFADRQLPFSATKAMLLPGAFAKAPASLRERAATLNSAASAMARLRLAQVSA